MKVLKNIFLFALAISFISACKSDPKSAFIKKWKVDAEATFNNLPEEQKKSMEKLGKEAVNQMKSGMSKSTMEFKKDGTFEAGGEGAVQKGKWKLSEDGKTLITSDDGAKEEQKIPILESSTTKIILELAQGASKFKMVLIPA